MSDSHPNTMTAEQELRESEERYRTLAELSPDATLVISERRLAYANPAAARMMAATDPQELLSHAPLQLVHPDYRDSVRERLRELETDGKTEQRLEYTLLRLDGSVVDVEASAAPVSWNGKPAVQVVARDVSERKRVEQELRDSEARYRTLFRSIDEGFCVVEMVFDEAGRPRDFLFQEVNPAFESQTGIVNAEGRSMRELAPKHEEYWYEIYGRVAQTGEPVRFTNRAGEIQGGAWFDVNAFRVGGEGSNKVGILFRDITERMRHEEEIGRLNTRLESMVETRTRQLQQANEELEAFNYSVSHDLRSPLRTIDGFAQALEEEYGEQLDEAARSYLHRVRSGAQRMGVLVDDLLRLSRLSRGKLDREKVDLAAIAREIAEELRAREPQRQAEIEIPPSLLAEGDAGLLRVVMENLMENAWKFTRDEEVTRIELGCRRDGQELIYYVRDNGAGFDPRYGSRLFVPFGRLHAATRFEGTGIGLAMVRRVVQLHGGRVWGEGQVDEGATFYFTLS